MSDNGNPIYNEEMEQEAPEVAQESGFSEELSAAGNQVVQEVEKLVAEGNVRRLIVKTEDSTLLDINLTLGVLGAGALAIFLKIPALIVAVAAAVAAISGKITIAIERTDGTEEEKEFDLSDQIIDEDR